MNIHPFHIIERTSRLLHTLTLTIIASLGAVMISVMVAQVVFRYGFNHSLFWSEELGRALLVWLTFFGAAAAYRSQGHVAADILTRSSTAPLAVFVRQCATLCCLALFVLMAWQGGLFFNFLKFQQTTTLGVSRQWPFLAIPLSGAIMAVHALYFLTHPSVRPTHEDIAS